MQFSTFILAIAAASVQASPIDERTTPALPKADCCWCDVKRGGMRCVVPDPKEGCRTTLAYCPFEPKTQQQCCCCDVSETPNAMQCRAIPKDEGCFCTMVACPFSFDKTFLPTYAQG